MFIPCVDIKVDASCRTATVCLWTNIWLLRAKYIPIPLIYKCWYGVGTYSGNRNSVTFLQLWRFLFVGIHAIAVYLPAYRCRKKSSAYLVNIQCR